MDNQDLIEQVKAYYDSKEVDAFYTVIWGEDNTHIGVYNEDITAIDEANVKTTQSMDALMPKINKSAKILEIGSGYGGAARYLAEKYGCQIDCLNISEKQNKRNRELNEQSEFGGSITVTAGNFEEIPFGLETYDIVFSQDALFHSGKKEQVFWEVSKVLKPEGRFIFTDPMQTEDLPEGALDDLLSQARIPNFGSMKNYQRYARRVDLERVFIKSFPEQMAIHYRKVLAEMEAQHAKLVKKTSAAFLTKTKQQMEAWIKAGEAGHLTWGIMQFQKRNK